jgi:hypothetical protein
MSVGRIANPSYKQIGSLLSDIALPIGQKIALGLCRAGDRGCHGPSGDGNARNEVVSRETASPPALAVNLAS